MNVINPKTSAVLRHRARFALQTIRPPKTAVCGAYHYENVGDMALAEVGRSYMHDLNPALQTTANIAKWPGRPNSLVCGGALVTNDLLDQLRQRFIHKHDHLSMIGVEIARSSEALTSDNRDFLNALPYVSLRNTTQLPLVADSAGNCNVRTMPDVAFAFAHEHLKNDVNRHLILGVNVTSGLGRFDGVTEKQLDALGRARNIFYRSVVENALQQGLEVIHIPFAIADDGQARRILSGLPVKYEQFEPNPYKVIEKIASCKQFLPSRFHALIFGLITATPITPFLYARKNCWLVEEYFDETDFLGCWDAEDIPDKCRVLQHAERTFIMSKAQLDNLKCIVDDEFSLALSQL